MSAGALRQLFALFDVDTGKAVTKLEELNDKTSVIRDALAAIGGSLLGAFSLHGVTSFIESQIELGSVLDDTAQRLGVNTDELQRFQFAAQMAGVEGDEAARALGFLNKNIGDALGGGEPAKQFAELGIQIKDASGNVRGMNDVLPEIANAFEKMESGPERTAAAMKLFGKSGAALIPLLKNGGEELAKMNEQFDALGLGIEEDFIQKAADTGDQLDILKLGFRALKTRAAAEILPTLTGMMKTFQQWVVWARGVTKETHIVKEAWWGLGITAGLVAGKTIHSWSKVLGLFPKGGSLIGNLFKMGELGLIIGGLVLLAGAIEDIVVMCQGGESVIGDFLDSMLGVEERQKLVDSLKVAWDAVKVSLDDVGPTMKELGSTFAQVLPFMIGMVADLLKVIATAFVQLKGFAEFTADLINGDKASRERTAQKTADETSRIWASGSTTWKMINAPATVPASAAGVPFGPPPPPANVNANTTINVNGAGDPETVARRVATFQRDVQQQAINDAANSLAAGTE